MQIYLVGGAVRDKLLNYPVYDRDWVVVGASADEMLAQGYQPVGQDFPVFIHPESGEEYALARTERKSGKGYTGFQYFASKEVTLEEDLLRRDLTINAMAEDAEGNIIDPYNGRQDLEQRYLRHVSPAFAEDPLRVLRVARFAARYAHLGFQVADETIQLMQAISATDELEHLTTERVWKECERALSEPSPEVFIQVLQKANALEKILPELATQITPATLKRFQNICQVLPSPEGRFACFLALFDSLDVINLCTRLKAPNTYKELAQQCTAQHAQLEKFDQLAAAEKLSTLQQLDLIRRPQRIQTLIPCITALHPQPQYQTLEAVLEEIAALQPAKLIKAGFQGAALGQEITRQRLEICQRYSPEESR